jgi:hypothetical protein
MKREPKSKGGRPPRAASRQTAGVPVVRIQTGVRMEKRMMLVLKALAGSLDLSLGDLLEGIVLHAFEGKPPFGPDTLAKINALKDVYGLQLSAADSHRLTEPRRPAERE